MSRGGLRLVIAEKEKKGARGKRESQVQGVWLVRQCVQPAPRTHEKTCPGQEQEAARSVALNSGLVRTARC